MQYFKWLGHVLQGDFGISLQQRTEVLPFILDRFKNTLIEPVKIAEDAYYNFLSTHFIEPGVRMPKMVEEEVITERGGGAKALGESGVPTMDPGTNCRQGICRNPLA